MRRYIVRRFLSMWVVLLGVVTLVFLTLHLAPGDPVQSLIPLDAPGNVGDAQVEKLRAELGLDQPLPVQYVQYLSRVARLDLGESFVSGQPIASELAQRVPATLQLGLAALVLALCVAVPAGVVSALRPNSWIDRTVMFVALSGISFPNFFLGMLLMLLFGLVWPILPPSGYAAGALFTWEGMRYLVLPALTLSASMAGTLARLTRSAMLDVMQEDYIRTARAKGLSPTMVVAKHAFRNALIPVVTVLGIQVGYLLGGAVIVETVFSWPGVGRYMVAGLVGRDYPVVQASILMLSSVFVVIVFLTDLSYSLIDPRIRYS